MQPIQGLHHITAVASDPQANIDFYERVLGQRLVKTTVNFDDPGTYHLYYGDEIGSPGTIMTYFPWTGMGRGKVGNGEASEVTWAIPATCLDWWAHHLAEQGIDVTDVEERFGDPALFFEDPDGLRLGIVATGEPSSPRIWTDGPIPEAHAIRGLHGVTLQLRSAAATATVLTALLGYEEQAREGGRIRYRAASNDMAIYVDLVEAPGAGPGRFGAGSIHHIAFRTVDDGEQLEYRESLAGAGLPVTPVRDRQYFRSIYFREPGGVLFEVATDAPGFLYDEPVEVLGESLKLPDWLEQKRTMIEPRLHPIRRYADSRRVARSHANGAGEGGAASGPEVSE